MAVEAGVAVDVALIIVTATIVGLIARQTGQPTIIAYILTGLLLGPPVLGWITPTELIDTMAELGLAFLLFLLGIKMRIEDIRHVLKPIVKISIPQMTLVFAAGAGVSLVVGFDLWQAIIIGLAVMYSSTAVVIKMLTDKGEATSLPGKIDIGVLLVQDIVVVILLAVLATGQPESAVAVGVTLGTILVLITIISIIALLASKYVLPPVFSRIADDKDVFFMVSVAWAFLFVFASMELDLSIEMGAFLAGIAIAQLPYSVELQDRVTPLTDLFIMIFFVSIGLQLQRSDLLAFWEEALIVALVLMPAKLLIFFFLIDWQDFDLETTFLGSIQMIQVSEFALVVGAVALAGGFIDEAVLGFLSLVALITMATSVYVIQYNHQLWDIFGQHLAKFFDPEGREDTSKTYKKHAIAVGYDPVTKGVLPRLAESFSDVVVIDRRTDHIEQLQAEAKYEYVFGDFRHGKVRKAANIKKAAFVISSSVQTDINKMILAETNEDTTVMVEAERIEDARTLYEAGADYVIMGDHLSAERVANLLDLYLEDEDAFTEEIETDLVRIERDARFGSTPSGSTDQFRPGSGGETDD